MMLAGLIKKLTAQCDIVPGNRNGKWVISKADEKSDM